MKLQELRKEDNQLCFDFPYGSFVRHVGGLVLYSAICNICRNKSPILLGESNHKNSNNW
jgi:hypothetical protein